MSSAPFLTDTTGQEIARTLNSFFEGGVNDPNYEGVDLTIKFALEIANFENECEWLQHRHDTQNFYGFHAGDYIPITLEGGKGTFRAEIMGINPYKGFSDQEIPDHIDWCFRELWPDNHVFNKVNYNNGISDQNNPFLASDLNYFMNSKSGNVPNGTGVNPATVAVDYTNGGIYKYFPQKWKDIIKPKRMLLPYRYSSSGLLTDDNSWGWGNTDPLWVPTECEVAGTAHWSNPGYGTGGSVQYKLFANNNKRVKRKPNGDRAAWWALSAQASSSTDVCYVHDGGPMNYNSATTSWVSVLVCFRTTKSA